MPSPSPTAFRDVPFMGVIRVVVEATQLGYSATDPNWSNLGQGQPEVGPLPGAPPRITQFELKPTDQAYGPVAGLLDLRTAVAAHYNRLYRAGKKSQYTAENVVIAAGGRTALTRGVAALSAMRLGYFIPDYTAYEDTLTAFRWIEPVLVANTAENRFAIDPDTLAGKIERERLGALLISNPCNPTGRVIAGPELAAWVELSRKSGCTLLLDEFYSHYIYAAANGPAAGPVSAAAHIDDVNRDPVILFDGLTKNYRYPGWRIGWAIGPAESIRSMIAAGSFVDGGPPCPVQRAALQVLEPARADQETIEVRRVFQAKRDLTVSTLREAGVEFPREPEGTFYAFGSVAKLPPPLNDGMTFYQTALRHRVLTVPGEFFDVNPHKQRPGRSPLAPWVRFSYGPPMDNLKAGLDRLVQMIHAARK